MASAEEPGQFIISYADQLEQNPDPIFSQHTNIISGGQKAAVTGETYKAIPIAQAGAVGVAFNKLCAGRILTYFNSDAADTVESEESQWEIPILLYQNIGGKLTVVGRKTLTQENMTSFTQAGTVDVVCAAGVPARLAYYDVPRGLYAAIDPNGKVRAYMGDDTA